MIIYYKQLQPCDNQDNRLKVGGRFRVKNIEKSNIFTKQTNDQSKSTP